MLRFLKYLFQLIISPGSGWEDISAAGDDKETIASNGLYPIFGIASASAFLQFFYNHNLGLVDLLEHAIIIYVQYFISYFLAIFLFSFFIGKCVDGEPNEKKYTTLIAYCLAVLSLFTIIENCLPSEQTIIQFLPIYVALIIWKGTRYLAVKESQMGRFMLMAIISIIGVPILLGHLFKLLIL